MKRLLERLGLRKSDDRDPEAARHTVQVRSTLDGALQPCVFIPARGTGPRPLLVYLHPWRHGYDTDSRRWQAEAKARDWHFLAPHFRGPNKRPQACASRLARQDVLDAVAFVKGKHPVDPRRIYAGGVSGGAHMALVMAAEVPEMWAGVSAWCAVTDLARFYDECVAQGAKAYRHIVKVCGGAPGSSPRVDEELRYRSPLFHMARAKDVPIDISHGIRDGQPRGIGIQHSIWAFNALAEARGDTPVPHDQLDALCRRENAAPGPVQDETYGRTIYLRRTSGLSRLTIFEGGHEDLPAAACAWLEQREKA
ncbi:MAG: prolyl oligopeptidase family serine peptidase [Candidatus Hydrogenedentes bacterium]|nr:prolyl oligopeptidase family serine peptidase [Candidatus Hydrogenedentota bacterium]